MKNKFDVKPFSLEEIPDLTEITSPHVFKPGQVLFYEGHQPYGLFILIDGTIEIELTEKKVERINAGAILGINSFMKFSAYTGTAKAITPCKVNFLSKSTYQELVSDSYPLLTWINR